MSASVFRSLVATVLMVCGFIPAANAARDDSTELPAYEVTATRLDRALDFVPAAVTTIAGDTLRARGASNLTEALAGVAGVEISPGGDNGPAGSVPAFWGLREFDAFLLVIDGVPAGGAFNPALTTVDLNNVKQIDVMRGAAPVMFGATSFVGVIHIIHYPAGESAQTAWLRGGGPAGNIGSFAAGGSTALQPKDGWQRSISASLDQTLFADRDAGVLRAHGLYRQARSTERGLAWRDLDLGFVHQTPDSPVVLEDAQPTRKTPLDANHNPSDAVFNELRIQYNRGSTQSGEYGRLSRLASVALTGAQVVRGFLEDPDNPAPNADGYEQTRGLLDMYLDTHVTTTWSDHTDLVYGADALLGAAGQKSELFEYTVPLDGSQRPSSEQGHRTKEGEAFDGRAFLGAYGQTLWQPTTTVDVFAGLRVNLTHELRKGEREEDINGNGRIDKPEEEFEAEVDDTNLRVTGTLGSSWTLWLHDQDHLVAFADYRNSFKPAAFEFAPEIEAEILNPETANSVEAGVHSALAGGHLDVELSAFYMDFKNVLVAEAQGVFNVGATRLSGAEFELDWHLSKHWDVLGSYAYHEAQYIHGSTPSGTNLAGLQLPMSPRHLASAGLLCHSDHGLFGNALVSYVGERYLDNTNNGTTPGYTTWDATVGYHLRRWTVSVIGHNLANQREPVSQSEFSEVATTVGPEMQPAVGAATAHYLLPARSIALNLAMQF